MNAAVATFRRAQRDARKALAAEIRAVVAPFMRRSLFRDDADAPMRVCMFAEVAHQTGGTTRMRSLCGGVWLTEFLGFSENGIVVDQWCGAIVESSYDDVPVDDLIRVLRMARTYAAKGRLS